MPTKLFHRDFTLVVIGQLISLFGNTILRFALSLYVLDVTASATVFGTVTALAVIPTILLSPLGGLLADRVNRRNIMVVLDFLTALLVWGFAGLLAPGNAVAATALLLVALSIIQACYTPAVQSSIPLLQREENFTRANAVVNQVTMLAGLVGPVLGGLLYGVLGVRPLLNISAACFFASALLELFIRIPHTPRDREAGLLASVRADLSDSARFLTREQPVVLRTILSVAAFSLFAVPVVTVGMPYLLRTRLGMDSALYGLAEGLMALAGVGGALLCALRGDRLRAGAGPLLLSALAVAPMGAAFLLPLPVPARYGVLVLSTMLLQVCFTVFSIVTLSAIQRRTPPALLGKVTACILSLTMCAQPAGQFLFGVLLDRVSVPVLLAGAAALSALLAGLARGTLARLGEG